MFKEVSSENGMKMLGSTIGQALLGGEIIELVGDVGAGKTTLVKGLAMGLGIDEYIQSPSFTINRTYEGRDNLVLSHYDFYRLDDVGIMANELAEVVRDHQTVTVIEWGGVARGVLPDDRMTINIVTNNETTRRLEFLTGGESSIKLLERIKQ